MTAPTLTDIEAGLKTVEQLPLIGKQAAPVLRNFLHYLAAQDARIETLERMVKHGNEETSNS